MSISLSEGEVIWVLSVLRSSLVLLLLVEEEEALSFKLGEDLYPKLAD